MVIIVMDTKQLCLPMNCTKTGENGGERRRERKKKEGKQRKKEKEIDKSKRVTRPKKKGSVMSQMRIIFAMLLRGEQDHSDVGCSSLYVFLLLVDEQRCFGLTGKI